MQLDPVTITHICTEKYASDVFSASNYISSYLQLDKDVVMFSSKKGFIFYNITTRSIDKYYPDAPYLSKMQYFNDNFLLVAMKNYRIVFYLFQPSLPTLQQVLIPLTRLTSNTQQFQTIAISRLKNSVIISGVDKETKKDVYVFQFSFDGTLLQKVDLMHSKDNIVDISFVNTSLCVVTAKELKIVPCLHKGRVLSKPFKNEIQASLPTFTRLSPAQLLINVNEELYSLTDASISMIETNAPVNAVVLITPVVLLFHELNPHRYFMSYFIETQSPSQLVRRPEFTTISAVFSPVIFCHPSNRLCIIELKSDWYKRCFLDGRLEEGLSLSKRADEDGKKWDSAGCILRIYELLCQCYQHFRIEKILLTHQMDEILKLLQRTKKEIMFSCVTQYIMKDFCPVLYIPLSSLFQLGTSDISVQVLTDFPEELLPRLNETMRMFLELRAAMMKKKLIPTMALNSSHEFLSDLEIFFDGENREECTACVLIQLHMYQNVITPQIQNYVKRHKNVDNSIVEVALKQNESSLLGYLTLMDDVPRIMALKLKDPLLRLDALVSIARNRKWAGNANDPLAIAFQEIVVTAFKRLEYSPINDGSRELQIIIYKIFGGSDSYLQVETALKLLEAWEVTKNPVVNSEASQRMKILYLTCLLDQYKNSDAPSVLVNWALLMYIYYIHTMAAIKVRVPLSLLKKGIYLVQSYPKISANVVGGLTKVSWECYPISCPIAICAGAEKGVEYFVSVLRKFYTSEQGREEVFGESGLLLRVEDDLMNFIASMNDKFGNYSKNTTRAHLLCQLEFYNEKIKTQYQPFLTTSVSGVELEFVLFLLAQDNAELIQNAILLMLDSYKVIPLEFVQTVLQMILPKHIPVNAFRKFLKRNCSFNTVYYKEFIEYCIDYIKQLDNHIDVLVDYLLEYTGLPGKDNINAMENLVSIMTDSPYLKKKLKQMENVNWRIRARLMFSSKYKSLLEYLKVFVEEYKQNKNYFDLFESELAEFKTEKCEELVSTIRANFKPFCDEKKCVLVEAIYYCLFNAPDGITSPLLAVLMKELVNMEAPVRYNIVIFSTFHKYIPPFISSEHDSWLGIKSQKVANRVHFRVYNYLIDSVQPSILIPLLRKSVQSAALELFTLKFKEMGLKNSEPELSKRKQVQRYETKCSLCGLRILPKQKFVVKSGAYFHVTCQ
ncbi:hypothetical protein EIN_316860 [Entamoeba invadens IP1]|uniref:Uncharacterized protein n=1 Tax=Entamoeba invadens IP1 TaxID=370355 RepID=A0A0A1TZF6_ENTIV|nr:hypothetical protein EIN_316860 [Entamoeba invadens IP1]ELP86967.1 hypothetical protein EIN_316860 [Entamoeba invadens IP1]|eukprot:XP_004253738.1 hypothetical protein EIN_316860 [Entamoeba invadens IP1]